jgi:MSHA biogenesis protein MshK
MKTLKFAIVAAVFVTPLSYAETLIDPTRPANAPTRAVVASSGEAAARVSAVFQTGGRRVAVLDGKVVKAGDRIGDAIVQEVMTDGVRLSRGGRIEVARLPKQAASVRRGAAEESNP